LTFRTLSVVKGVEICFCSFFSVIPQQSGGIRFYSFDEAKAITGTAIKREREMNDRQGSQTTEGHFAWNKRNYIFLIFAVQKNIPAISAIALNYICPPQFLHLRYA
jgi:hypothetical protein